MRIAGAWPLVQCAARHWAKDRAATIGAALAFYCAFSLAPLLIILVTLTGWIVGAEMASRQLGAQLTALFGAGTAATLMNAMQSSQTGDGITAAAVSLVTLFIGATTVFSALEGALQQVWGSTKLAPTGVREGGSQEKGAGDEAEA